MREADGGTGGYREGKIPEATVQRLSIYLRYVTQLHRDGVKVVSSYALSKGCGVKAAQVRKDFAYFGELGVRGVGYYVHDLCTDLQKILGLDQVWEVALVGAGQPRLGAHRLQGLRGVRLHDLRRLRQQPRVPPRGAARGVPGAPDLGGCGRCSGTRRSRSPSSRCPAAAAQQVVDELAAAGVKAILNFAPARLETPPGVKVRNVDLAVDLGVSSFFVTGKK